MIEQPLSGGNSTDTVVRVGATVRKPWCRSTASVHELLGALRSGGVDVPAAMGQWDVLLPVDGADLICHNDLAPWNLIVGDRWIFIDWDGAGPSTRLWDLAYAAQSFSSLVVGEPVESAGARLRAFVDGYGADGPVREALPAALARRALAMWQLLASASEAGRQPWARMFHDGHGEHWRSAAGYVAAHESAWAAALR